MKVLSTSCAAILPFPRPKVHPFCSPSATFLSRFPVGVLQGGRRAALFPRPLAPLEGQKRPRRRGGPRFVAAAGTARTRGRSPKIPRLPEVRHLPRPSRGPSIPQNRPSFRSPSLANNGTFVVGGLCRLQGAAPSAPERSRQAVRKGAVHHCPTSGARRTLAETGNGLIPLSRAAAREGRRGREPPRRERGTAPFPARTEPRPPRAPRMVFHVWTHFSPGGLRCKGFPRGILSSFFFPFHDRL